MRKVEILDPNAAPSWGTRLAIGLGFFGTPLGIFLGVAAIIGVPLLANDIFYDMQTEAVTYASIQDLTSADNHVYARVPIDWSEGTSHMFEKLGYDPFMLALFRTSPPIVIFHRYTDPPNIVTGRISRISFTESWDAQETRLDLAKYFRRHDIAIPESTILLSADVTPQGLRIWPVTLLILFGFLLSLFTRSLLRAIEFVIYPGRCDDFLIRNNKI